MSPLLFLAIAILVPLIGMTVLGIGARLQRERITDDETEPFRRQLASLAPPDDEKEPDEPPGLWRGIRGRSDAAEFQSGDGTHEGVDASVERAADAAGAEPDRDDAESGGRAGGKRLFVSKRGQRAKRESALGAIFDIKGPAPTGIRLVERGSFPRPLMPLSVDNDAPPGPTEPLDQDPDRADRRDPNRRNGPSRVATPSPAQSSRPTPRREAARRSPIDEADPSPPPGLIDARVPPVPPQHGMEPVAPPRPVRPPGSVRLVPTQQFRREPSDGGLGLTEALAASRAPMKPAQPGSPPLESFVAARTASAQRDAAARAASSRPGAVTERTRRNPSPRYRQSVHEAQLASTASRSGAGAPPDAIQQSAARSSPTPTGPVVPDESERFIGSVRLVAARRPEPSLLQDRPARKRTGAQAGARSGTQSHSRASAQLPSGGQSRDQRRPPGS